MITYFKKYLVVLVGFDGLDFEGRFCKIQLCWFDLEKFIRSSNI